jgi:hypothetical protein
MKKYQIGFVRTTLSNGILVEGTNVISSIRPFIEEIKKGYPNVRMDDSSFGLDKKPCISYVSKLDSKDFIVGWLIIEQLGNLGWEPFGVERGDPNQHPQYDHIVFFRKEIDE